MIYFLACFIALVVFCAIMAYKFRNPYKLTMVFGKKGSGKTTFLVKKAVQYMRAGKTVYSTVYIPGAYLFDVNLVGNCTFPRESVVFIDEVGMIWDNRNFKAFRTEVRDWFKLQRHHHVKVYLFSQTFDIDIKLRNLTDEMYLCTCHMGFISIARKIKRSITLVHPSGDAESRITDDLEFVPLWFSLFGAKSAIFTYIPNWVKYFDSFEVPELPLIPAELQQVPFEIIHCYASSFLKRLFSASRLYCRKGRNAPRAALARGRVKYRNSKRIYTNKRYKVHLLSRRKKG